MSLFSAIGNSRELRIGDMVRTRSQTSDGRDSDVHGPTRQNASGSDVSDGENAQHQRQIAKAIIDHEAANIAELSFHAGDEIISIKSLGPNYWEGTNRATGKKGMFLKDHVNFLLETTEGGQLRLPRDANEETLQSIRLRKRPPPQVTSSNKKDSRQITQNNLSAVFVVIIAAAVVVLCIASGQLGFMSSGKIRVNITEMKTQFSSQEPAMWETLRAGLMSSRSEGVQTFLFLHNSPRTAVCFIKKLSENSCIAFKANDVSNSESFVSVVKEKLLAHKCLVMFDLEDLHPDGVAVLKGFCDAYEPIVPDTKFFFALNAGTQLDTEAKKLARSLLEAKWSKDFTYDDFGGTLTRLTQNVLKIRNEPNVPC